MNERPPAVGTTGGEGGDGQVSPVVRLPHAPAHRAGVAALLASLDLPQERQLPRWVRRPRTLTELAAALILICPAVAPEYDEGGFLVALHGCPMRLPLPRGGGRG